MSKLTVVVSTEQADFIRQAVAPVAEVDIWPAGTEVTRTVAIGDAARTVLEQLPEDADGHLDSEGRIWIGGSEYQTTPLADA